MPGCQRVLQGARRHSTIVPQPNVKPPPAGPTTVMVNGIEDEVKAQVRSVSCRPSRGEAVAP
jgi:hypothetical protein